MPAPVKVQDEQEAVRWLEEGRTYQWMVDKYREKYGIETSTSMWGNFRKRMGLSRRFARNDELIPWAINKEHRWMYPIVMLRMEARRREGYETPPERAEALDVWINKMKRDGLVLHYDPDTEQGFWLLPARPGVDTDLIRVPDRKTTSRKNAEGEE